MIEHYSKGIQNVILSELFKAKQSISIAVAWFTNDLLFQPLLLKLELGVKVTIILNRDGINNSNDNVLDFDRFEKLGGIIYWNDTNRLLHDKFCIIDDNVVIAGSFNWTNKANFNEESISIYKDEPRTESFYRELFCSLIKKYGESDQVGFAESSVPLRLAPFSQLQFYDRIAFRTTRYVDFVFGFWEAKHRYALLDNKSFIPRTPFIFTEIGSPVRTKQNKIWLKGDSLWGLFDSDALEYTVSPRFDSIIECRTISSCCYFFIASINNLLGLVDDEGQLCLPCVYDELVEEHPGVGSYGDNIILKKNGLFGIFYVENRATVSCEYDKVSLIGSGLYASLLRNNKYGISYCGRIVSQFIYDAIESRWCTGKDRHSDGCIVMKDGFYGVYNKDKLVINCLFDSISAVPNNPSLFICKIHDKYGVFDSEGNTILQTIYDKIEYGRPYDRERFALELGGKKSAYYIKEKYLYYGEKFDMIDELGQMVQRMQQAIDNTPCISIFDDHIKNV